MQRRKIRRLQETSRDLPVEGRTPSPDSYGVLTGFCVLGPAAKTYLVNPSIALAHEAAKARHRVIFRLAK
jgi:hypothetical protein